MDYSSLGTVTGACHAPVAGRQGKALADTAPRISRPHRKIRRFGDGWQRGFPKSSLPVGGSVEATSIAERLSVTPWILQSGYYLHASHGRGFRRSRIPPRRAHDTLQPQDESIIVGYYTSAGSALRPAGRTNVKGALWRETTGLTVPVQET